MGEITTNTKEMTLDETTKHIKPEAFNTLESQIKTTIK